MRKRTAIPLTRIALLKGLQDPGQEVPVSDPVANHLGGHNRAQTLSPAPERMVLRPYTHGEREGPAENPSQDPSPGRQVDAAWYEHAREPEHYAWRRRDDKQKPEEEGHPWRDRQLAAHSDLDWGIAVADERFLCRSAQC